jgi:Zn ribbon nucleic-acid-binding protein
VFCPRCDKEDVVKIFEAPKDRSWELYRCLYCNFVWRNTEKDYIKKRELYDPRFKLSEEKIHQMVDKPAIPPLRENRS